MVTAEAVGWASAASAFFTLEERMIDMQKLYTVTPRAMKDVALKCCGVLQRTQGETVVAGVACFFLFICKRYDMDVRQVLDTTERVIRDSQDKDPVSLRALATYLREELND
jgi:hypothetical protein